jgi:hypothetical protein
MGRTRSGTTTKHVAREVITRTPTITLEAYQQAEREFTQREAHSGLRVRAVVTVLLWALVPRVDFMTPCR